MGKGSAAAPERIDLFEYSEEQLLEDKELTYYQILNVPEYASQDEIKKAYRRTSLKYHPDKTARGDDDYVFLAVKQAHDTLFDNAKRQAYDSTVMPFDDHIPAPRASLLQDPLLLYKDDDFYDTFGPVFQRNLRFDLRLRPDLNKKSGTSGRNSNKPTKPPSLGSADTPIEQVHAFYEYWIHFESWRDFSATAADELQVEQELENAESRYEKRWYQKEIDKRAKQLKRQEMSRISTLVERAMEADPRLRQERAEKVRQKEEAAAARQRQKELDEEEKQKEQERQEQLEKEQAEQAAQEKMEREKEKKILRKARQQLRRMASASFENSGSNNKEPSESSARGALWDDAYDMQQDVEFLCANLDMDELNALSNELGAETTSENLKLLHERAMTARQNAAAEEEEQQQQQLAASTKGSIDKKNGARSGSSSNNPWTREELSALAKAVKKYPPGGSSRWDQICLFVNNLCRQTDPRTKEECIEQYNQVARGNRSGSSDATTTPAKSAGTSSTAPQDTSDNAATNTAETTTNNENTTDAWTPAQDQQLQDALAQYPASMDKNERWSSIAAAVPGKSKKQCVARFKAIREALKKSKK